MSTPTLSGSVNRRDFLKLTGLAGGGFALAFYIRSGGEAAAADAKRPALGALQQHDAASRGCGVTCARGCKRWTTWAMQSGAWAARAPVCHAPNWALR